MVEALGVHALNDIVLGGADYIILYYIILYYIILYYKGDPMVFLITARQISGSLEHPANNGSSLFL